MDYLPSNYSPFRQQFSGSWFRSQLNSSIWHTSFQCAGTQWVKTAQNCTSTLTVNTHRSVCPLHVGQDGTELHVDAHGQHSQKCVHCMWVKTAQNCTSTLTVSTHRSVCPLHVGQDGTEMHVDAHGQHSQKCVSTVGQDGMHRNARRRSRSTLTEVCVSTRVKMACIWLVPHTRHMGSKPDSVRSLGVSNRADHMKVVHSMSDVHGLRKHIAVCFHTGWTVLVPFTELANIRVHSSV